MGSSSTTSTASLLPWEQKQLFIEDVSSKIRNGSHIYIGNFASTAQATITSIVDDVRLVDIEIIQLYPSGQLPHIVSQSSSPYSNAGPNHSTAQHQQQPRIRTSAFFAFLKTASSVKEGLADYIPASTARFPRLLQERGLQIDVAIIKVTPPNEHGYVNLGVGIDVTPR